MWKKIKCKLGKHEYERVTKENEEVVWHRQYCKHCGSYKGYGDVILYKKPMSEEEINKQPRYLVYPYY